LRWDHLTEEQHDIVQKRRNVGTGASKWKKENNTKGKRIKIEEIVRHITGHHQLNSTLKALDVKGSTAPKNSAASPNSGPITRKREAAGLKKGMQTQ